MVPALYLPLSHVAHGRSRTGGPSANYPKLTEREIGVGETAVGDHRKGGVDVCPGRWGARALYVVLCGSSDFRQMALEGSSPYHTKEWGYA